MLQLGSLHSSRDVRGPLSLLKSQLVGQTTGRSTVVDFVENLTAKLSAAREQAALNDSQAKKKSKSVL